MNYILSKKQLSLLFTTLMHSLLFCQTWNTDFGDSLYNESGGWPIIKDLHAFNNNLYIAANVEFAGNIRINGICFWDGSNWNNLQDGITTYISSNAIEDYNNEIYLGGGFWEVDSVPNTKYLARWDGMNWYSVGNEEISYDIRCMKRHNDDLFVAGIFALIGSELYQRIARWDGANWHQLGAGLQGGIATPRALAIYNNELVVGGTFYYAGGQLVYFIARWDGAQWHSLNNGVSGYVTSLIVDTVNNFLYIGGSSLHGIDDTIPANDIAMWDGERWYALGEGFWCDVLALEMYRGELYAGGCFDSTGNLQVNYISRWDGLKWDTLTCGIYGTVEALEVYNDELYVGGGIHYAGGMKAYGLARWYMPPGYNCNMLQPRIMCSEDTVYLWEGLALVQFYNNNAYSESWVWDFGDGGTASVQNPEHIYTDTGTYNVCVTVTYEGCVKDTCRTITVLNGTTISEYESVKQSFKIYPNPAGTEFIIEATLLEKNVGYVSVIGLQGCEKARYSLTGGSNRIIVPVTGWQAGTYLCNLVIDRRFLGSERLVVAR
ncbi:MAG: PKD domain-containing protein [Bacteroidia bacterium]|nr:PKD domain-containing protein [Bacteroidia bacterium]